MKQKSSGLPDISSLVRPFMAISISSAVIVSHFINPSGVSADMLIGTFGAIVGFYFGERSALKTPGKKR